jgi:hypothetical protein
MLREKQDHHIGSFFLLGYHTVGSEEGRNKSLRNVGKLLPDCTVLLPRRRTTHHFIDFLKWHFGKSLKTFYF